MLQDTRNSPTPGPAGIDATLLRAVVDTAVDGLILIDARGSVLMFNPACERLFDYDASEVIGQNVKMLMPAPYREEHDRYLDNFHQSGVRKIIGIGRQVVGRRRDGSTFPMDLAVGEAKQDGESFFVGIIHDLTERERVGKELREGAARLKAVVETAVDGVILQYVCDPDMTRSREDLQAVIDMVAGLASPAPAAGRRLGGRVS